VDIYNKGDSVIIDTFATGYGSNNELRGIIIKEDKYCETAQVLIGGVVAIMPVCHLKKIAPQKNPNMNNCKDLKKPVENT
tara:strand:+ start:1712 stop:1951 length:240 start_codon:yes stop_codon:yes gene_type:complete